MDAYNKGYNLVNKAIAVTKNGLRSAETGEEVTFAETTKPKALGQKMKTPEAGGIDITSVIGKDRTLDKMFGGVIANLAQEVRLDRSELVEVYFPVGTEVSEILDKTGLPATYFYAANMDNTEMENGKFLIPKEDYARMKEAGLLEKEPDRTAFGSIGLDFEERE